MEIDNKDVFEQKIEELQDQLETYKKQVEEYKLKFSTYTKEQSTLLMKIQLCKQELNNMNIKKTGKNNYQNYEYYELEDINKPICDTLLKQGLASIFNFKEDEGYLQIVDTETGAWMQWYTPVKTSERWEKNKQNSNKKGDVGESMKATQALQTYARRALYLQALEISEPNTIEQETNTTIKQEKTIKQELQLKGLDEITNSIFKTIRNDFKKNKVQYNTTTITNKLNSMCKNGKIDKDTHMKCIQIVKEAGKNEN